MSPNPGAVALVVAICGLAPLQAAAQEDTCRFRGAPSAVAERPSPPDSVIVDLAGAQAKLCYGRPTTVGPVFGTELPWGSPWQMGANEPTTLHLWNVWRDDDVEHGWLGWAGLVCAEEDDGRWTLSCSDGHPPADFTDLVVDVSVAASLSEPWENGRVDGELDPADHGLGGLADWLSRCTGRPSWERVRLLER